MNPPVTPTKAGKDIDFKLEELSRRWNLDIPLRDPLWSPSENTHKTTGGQIYSIFQFLYWQKGKTEGALAHAIAQFEDLARRDWVPKPRADLDLLPGRIHPRTHQNFLKTRGRNDEETEQWQEILLGVLKSVADKVKAGSSYPVLKDGANNCPVSPVPPAKYETSPQLPPRRKPSIRGSSIHEFFKPLPRSGLSNSSPNKMQHPSSDEFHEEDSFFTELMMPDALSMVPKQTSNSSDEYKTPSQQCTATRSPMKPTYIFRKPDPVPVTRKRALAETSIPSIEDQVAREKRRSSGYSRSRSANELGSGSTSDAIFVPRNNHQMHGPSRQTESSEGANFTRSFSTSSSVSLASSRAHSSTGFDTPNTSFRTDSVSTSFGLGMEADEATITLSKSADILPEGLNWPQRSTSEPPSSGITKPELAAEGCAVEHDLQRPRITPEPVRGTYSLIKGLKVEDYLDRYLFQDSPFATCQPDEDYNTPFRQLYEVTRVAKACKLPLAEFHESLKQGIDSYESLWKSLESIAKVKAPDAAMPERSSLAAWNRAVGPYSYVGLSGGLKFSEAAGEPLMKFNLKPLKLESSYRLARNFGGDRFCVISMPTIEPIDLPKDLRNAYGVVRPALVKWIVDTDHHFLGRKWRAFYTKPDTTKRSLRQVHKKQIQPGFRVFFFAEDGNGFCKSKPLGEPDPRKANHQTMAVSGLINWFMPVKRNRDQLCLKLFARFALAVSSTEPTIVFKAAEIIRSDDAYAHDPRPRRLNMKRSDDKKKKFNPSKNRKVMNDGCARISRAAARGITEELGLDTIPSVFQGRIAGAKGVWMVDALNENLPHSSRGYWIEITDSQLKFEGSSKDSLFPDAHNVTFEVHSYSKKIGTSRLNFQLMPILADRGVRYEVFKRLLEEDLTARVRELEVAMDSTLALRKWNQDNNPITEERLNNRGIDMVGGIPDSTAEKINWFVEHGFEPKSCRVLKDHLYKAIMDYCLRLEERMNIELGKSTYAFMIADPLALLEENEVHIGFSSMFQDPKSGWSEVMLHDMDILVARLPALLPSDIQKVRAVFKPELGIYRDVIIFSSKGNCSLAEKLSGGDFDGDKAWICWEPSIVEPFQNACVPEEVPLKDFGIEKDELRVSEVFDLPDFTSRFLLHAFDFNLRPNMLGTCTAYHEAMCYHENSISSRPAVSIAFLLGHLVDRAKGGIIFEEAHWKAYLKKSKLRPHPKPAYKDKKNTRPRDHLIDNLVFKVAKNVREDALGKFAKHFPDVGTQEDDLFRLWLNEVESAKHDDDLLAVLNHLKRQLNKIYDFWKANASSFDDIKESTVRRGKTTSFRAMVEKCRGDFLAIQPLALDHPVVKRWRQQPEQSKGCNSPYWDLLKASAAYHEFHKTKSFPWYVAGIELGELKVTAGGKGTYRIVKNEIFEAFKLDNKVVKRRQEAEARRAIDDDDDDDDLGDFDWDDIDIR